jgi:hypothetical protein
MYLSGAAAEEEAGTVPRLAFDFEQQNGNNGGRSAASTGRTEAGCDELGCEQLYLSTGVLGLNRLLPRPRETGAGACPI